MLFKNKSSYFFSANYIHIISPKFITKLKITKLNTASEFHYSLGTRNVHIKDHITCIDQNKCFDAFSNCLFINFCNIRSLRCNFNPMENNVFCSKCHILFLTEKQDSELADDIFFLSIFPLFSLL